MNPKSGISKKGITLGFFGLCVIAITSGYFYTGGFNNKYSKQSTEIEKEEHELALNELGDATFAEKMAWSQMDASMNSSSQVQALSSATSIGPTNIGGQGGRLKTSWIDRADSLIIIAGSETGGIWRSTNGGSTWTICTPDNALTFDVNDISQDPTNNNIYYYAANDGTTDINDGTDLGTATLIYKSTDRGVNWTLLSSIQSGITTGTVRDIVHVSNSSTFYFSAGNSLYKSTTGGSGFALVYSNAGAPITDLEIFPDNHILFTQGTTVYNSTAASPDVFVVQTGTGRIPSTAQRIEMDFCTGSPSNVYAFVEIGGNPTAYKSTDGGLTWSPCATIVTGTGFWERSSIMHWSIMVHPTNPLKFAVASVELLVSTNGGSSWTYSVSRGHDDICSFTQNLSTGGTNSFYLNNDGGLWRKTWNSITASPTSLNNNMSIHQAFGGYYFPSTLGGGSALIAGFQDRGSNRYYSGTWSGISGGDGGCANFVEQSAGNYGFVRATNDSYYYGNLSTSPSINSTMSNSGSWHSHNMDANEVAQAQFYTVTLSQLFRSTNSGVANTPVLALTQGLNQCFVNNETDPSIYIPRTGTGTTGYLARVDNAATSPVLVNISTSNIPETDKRIKSISCHPTDHNVIYVVKYKSGKVYKVTNAKTSTPLWDEITPNIANVFMRALWIEINPNNPKNLYLGTYFGMYYSNDDGETWSKYTSIPNVRVYQLRLRASDNKLFIFTYGRGIWTTTATPSPVVVTNSASAVTTRSATLNGNIDANNSNTTAQFQYGTDTNYGTTVSALPLTVTGTNPTAVSIGISNLADNQIYHYRTVGTNALGDIVYGGDQQFTTLTATTPTVITTTASAITGSSASSGGNVTSDGGANVTARGVCWNTSPGVSLANSFTVNGSGTGIFTSTISPLNPATTYYYRAYATNSKGTSYGVESNFITSSGSQSYCAIGGTNNTNPSKFISNVKFQNSSNVNLIDNNSGIATNSYQDFTSISASVTANSSYKIILTYLNQFTNIKSYIDYDRDGVFESTELVYSGSKLSGFIQNLTIPAAASNGSTRMRVMLSNNTIPDGGCGTITDGEVEDYTIIISGGSGRLMSDADSRPSIIVYPNPVLDMLTIDSKIQGLMNLTFYDIKGQRLYSVESTANNPVDVSALQPGAYILQVSGNGFEERQKFIKE